MLIDYTSMNKFSRAFTKYKLLNYIAKKYNKVLEPKDFFLILGLSECLEGELKATYLNDQESYNLLYTYSEKGIKKIYNDYYTRGQKLWQKQKEQKEVTLITPGSN